MYHKEIVTQYLLMLRETKKKKSNVNWPETRQHQHGHEWNHNLEPEPKTLFSKTTYLIRSQVRYELSCPGKSRGWTLGVGGRVGILDRNTEECAIRRLTSLTLRITWQIFIVFFMTQDICVTIFSTEIKWRRKIRFLYQFFFFTGNCIRKLQNMWIAVGRPRIESYMKYITKILTFLPNIKIRHKYIYIYIYIYIYGHLFWNPRLMVICFVFIFNRYKV